MKTKTPHENGIKRLYHYQSFEKPERFARIFIDGKIFFSTPRDFNDPWDCRPCFSKSVLDWKSGCFDLTVKIVRLDSTAWHSAPQARVCLR